MQFTWNKQKRLTNIQKHGIDFEDALHMFYGSFIIIEDERYNYDEQRFWAVGFVKTKLLIVVHTYVRDDLIRIISAREATKREYEQFLT